MNILYRDVEFFLTITSDKLIETMKVLKDIN